MKKLFLSLALMATVLFTACQKEEINPNAQGASQVTFSVEIPDIAQTRAISEDGSMVNKLIYTVYQTTVTVEDDAYSAITPADKVYSGEAIVKEGISTATIELLNDQNYVILFWAQRDDKWGSKDGKDGKPVIDLLNITYPGELSANDETLEAYSGKSYVSNINGSISRDIILTRPFAQINVGTTLPNPENFTVKLTESDFIVRGAGNKFNVATGEPDENENANPEFNDASLSKLGTLTVNEKNYTYVAMNYIFARESVEVEFNIETESHGTVNTVIPNVPVKKNFKTNIVGNLLTSNASYIVTINDDWAENSPKYIVNTTEALENAIASAKSGETIYIAGEVTMPYFTGKALKFEGVTENATVKQSPATHIDEFYKDAELHFKNVTLVGTAYLANTHGYQKAAVETYTECTFVDYIMFAGAETVVDNCTFTGNLEQYFWTGSAKDITFNECVFNTKDRAVKVCTSGNHGARTVTFNKCNFTANVLNKSAIEIDGTKGSSYTVNINECTATGFAAGSESAETMFNVKGEDHVVVYIDGKKWEGNGMFVGANGEIAVTKTEALATAVNTENAKVTVKAGTYTFPASSFKPGVEVTCEEGTVFTGASSLDIKGATIKGAKFSNPSGNVVSGTINGTFENCNFEGANALRYSYVGETVKFINCYFKATSADPNEGWVFHYDGGANNIECVNCTFDGRRVAIAGSVKNVTMEKCNFINGSYFNMYNNGSLTDCNFNTSIRPLGGTITYNSCTSNDQPLTLTTFRFYEGYNCNVVIDNVNYTWKDGVLTTESNTVVALNTNMLKAALSSQTANITLMPGVYEGVFEITKSHNITSYDIDDKATIQGRINVKADNYTNMDLNFTNVNFATNDDSKVVWTSGGSTMTKKPSIIMAEANLAKIKFENCDFNLSTPGAFAYSNGTATSSIFKGCKFNGTFNYVMYVRANIEITDCIYNTSVTNVLVGACINALENGKVKFVNNELTNPSNIGMSAAIVFSSTNNNSSGEWAGPVEFNVKNNTGFQYTYERFNNFPVNPDKHTFTEDSERFTF